MLRKGCLKSMEDSSHHGAQKHGCWSLTTPTLVCESLDLAELAERIYALGMLCKLKTQLCFPWLPTCYPCYLCFISWPSHTCRPVMVLLDSQSKSALHKGYLHFVHAKSYLPSQNSKPTDLHPHREIYQKQ